MKKTLASLMLAGSVLGGLMVSVSSVSASVVKNPDGSQTVQGQQNAQVEFKGQIGEINPDDPNVDPTDPTAPGAGTDWIKVTLPTQVVYSSTAASAHKNITSPAYTVTNQSVYPVDVQLTGFVGSDGTSAPDINKVGDLALKAGGNSIDLVKAKVAQTPNSSIFKLGTDPAKKNRQDTTGLPMNNTFNIAGTTAAGAKLDERTILNNKLNITLVGLDKDGKVPAPKV